MKQRILSLFMAVLMIVTAIPVLILPATAAGEHDVFETSFEPKGDNWPTLSEDGTGVDYHGDWSIGKLTAGVYEEMDLVNSSLYLTVSGDQWGRTGVFTFLKEAKSAVLAPFEYGGPGIYDGPDDEWHVALSYTYTSPYEGKANLSITDIIATADGNSDNTAEDLGQNGLYGIFAAYFAIFVNDTMVWPVAGGDVLDNSNFEIYPKIDEVDEEGNVVSSIDFIESEMLQEIDVQVGDQIRFVSAHQNCRYIKYTPHVTFENYNLTPSTLNVTYSPANHSWPVAPNVNGVGRMLQEDAYWTLGNFDSAEGKFAAYGYMMREASDAWGVVGANKADYIENHGIMIESEAPVAEGGYMFGAGEDASLMPAYQYTAIATGKANLSAQKIVLLNANMKPAVSSSAALVYFVNGTQVGEVTVTTDAAGVATATGFPTDLSLVKGDKIVFAAKKESGKVTVMNAQPMVEYTSIVSFVGSADITAEYALSMEKETIIVGDKIGIKFAAFATRPVYEKSDDGILLRVWGVDVEGEKTVDNATIVPMELDINAGFAYICEYDAFAPKQMNDVITVQAYITVDGEEVCASEMKEVSIAAIALEQYNEAVAKGDEATAKLMAATLNYGAAAQKYFNYNTDNLANAQLPADAQVVEIKPDGYYSAAEMDTVPWDGNESSSDIYAASLIFGSTISIRVYVNITADEAASPEKKVVRHGTSEDEMTEIGYNKATTLDAGNSFVLSGIGLADLSQIQYFQFMVKIPNADSPIKPTYYGNVFTYSVEAYVARMAYDESDPALAELCHALMNLSACVTEQA